MHQIQREKRTIISEVIVRGKRNVKQLNRNWFYFNLLLKVLVLHLRISKRKTCKGCNCDQFVINFLFGFTRVSFCQNLFHFTLGQ